MVELVSAAAAAAVPRAMVMLMLMVDTKFVPLLLHLPCIVIAVEEYLGNALLCQIELLSVVVLSICSKQLEPNKKNPRNQKK